MRDEDRRTLQRFVAGLDVGPDALAAAITAQAVDETIVDEALLTNLASKEAVVRRRAARRIARMTTVALRVQAQLVLMANTDPDERTRAAAAEAIRVHEEPVDPVPEPERSRWPRWLAVLSLEPLDIRSDSTVPQFGPVTRSEALYAGGTLVTEDGVPCLRLAGLPDPFVGTRPVVVVEDRVLARADEPVDADGEVVIRFPPEAGSFATIHGLLRLFDLAVPED